jgi:hypothetical protein
VDGGGQEQTLLLKSQPESGRHALTSPSGVSGERIAFPVISSAFPVISSAFPVISSAFPVISSAFPAISSAFPAEALALMRARLGSLKQAGRPE